MIILLDYHWRDDYDIQDDLYNLECMYDTQSLAMYVLDGLMHWKSSWDCEPSRLIDGQDLTWVWDDMTNALEEAPDMMISRTTALAGNEHIVFESFCKIFEKGLKLWCGPVRDMLLDQSALMVYRTEFKCNDRELWVWLEDE